MKLEERTFGTPCTANPFYVNACKENLTNNLQSSNIWVTIPSSRLSLSSANDHFGDYLLFYSGCSFHREIQKNIKI